MKSITCNALAKSFLFYLYSAVKHLEGKRHNLEPGPREEPKPSQISRSQTILPEGMYEVECVFEDSSLLDLKQNCKKKERHAEFKLVEEFKEEHLPRGYQYMIMVELIKSLAVLTVRLEVKEISESRPEVPYPPVPRGTRSLNGSGYVAYVKIYTEKDAETCLCEECVDDGAPKTRWGKIFIQTAAHVVYDDKEASKTTCYFFYDNNDEIDKNVVKIIGLKNVKIDVKEDRSWMVCYSHDMFLLASLQIHVEKFEQSRKRVRDLCSLPTKRDQETDKKLTIIVSHPHGLCKRVSVGEFVDKIGAEDDLDWVKYTYTTHTCAGSSGAPVFILGKHGWYDNHVHSGYDPDKQVNYSTYGLF